MIFYSTKDKNNTSNFKNAVIKGLANDGGLFVPETIGKLPKDFLDKLNEKTPVEIATEIMNSYVGNEIPKKQLESILREVLSFDFPLVEIEKNKFALELFHGPTLAFKDVGAGFLARCLGYFADSSKKATVLVATSGDTGSAVANGFFGVKNTEVVILYPSGKVSESQEKQLTTYGGNITALEVDGTFDDCQQMVKDAFLDEELNTSLNLSSANSINVARFLPQTIYYFVALRKLIKDNNRIIVSVPSGNFGNLLAGIYAKKMGLDIYKFVVSNNANNPVVDYINSGIFKKRPSVKTISNAMDIGNPSNFERLKYLYPSHEELCNLMEGYSFSDKETLECIEDVYTRTSYLPDPHGAVAYLGLNKAMQKNKDTIGVFVETAHPAKFIETFTDSQKENLIIPKRLSKFMSGKKVSIKINNKFVELKKYLLNH